MTHHNKLIICLFMALTLGTANSYSQNYAEINRNLAKDNISRYMDNGYDLYNKGKYDEAEQQFRKARDENNRYNGALYDQNAINKKLEDCAYAKRNGTTREKQENKRTDDLIDAFAGLFSSKKNSNTNNNTQTQKPQQTTTTNNTANEIHEISYRGMTYSTPKNNTGGRILSVTRTETETIVDMEYINCSSQKMFYSMNRNAYIKDRTNITNQKILLESLENCPYSKDNNFMVDPGESVVFRMHFGPTPSNCQEIDIIESGTSSWRFYHVPVKPIEKNVKAEE